VCVRMCVKGGSVLRDPGYASRLLGVIVIAFKTQRKGEGGSFFFLRRMVPVPRS
jgi:hypothetical protein